MKSVKCPICKNVLLKYDEFTTCKKIYAYCKQCRKKETINIFNVLETGIITKEEELLQILDNLKIEHKNKDIDFETIEFEVKYPDSNKKFITGYKIIIY